MPSQSERTLLPVAPDVLLSVRSEGAGDTVLLVHGTVGSAGDWAPVRRLLRDRFRVISYDRRGRGGSSDAASYDIGDEVADLLAVLDWIGAPTAVVAHSFGARLALLAAPEAASLTSLVLYEPPLAPDAALLSPLTAASDAQDWDRVVESFLSRIEVDEAQVAQMRASPQVWDALVDAAPTVRREVAGLVASGFDPDSVVVGVPAHVLVGGETTTALFLRGLDELCARLHTTPTTLSGQKHLANVLAPELFSAEVARLLDARRS